MPRMKGSLVCSLPLAVGVALLAAYQPMAAADATPVSLRYTFAPGQTNVYNLPVSYTHLTLPTKRIV